MLAEVVAALMGEAETKWKSPGPLTARDTSVPTTEELATLNREMAFRERARARILLAEVVAAMLAEMEATRG